MLKAVFHFLKPTGVKWTESHHIDTPDAPTALQRLEKLSHARLAILDSDHRMVRLKVPGCPVKKVDWKGRFESENYQPWEVLAIRYQGKDWEWALATLGGVPRDIFERSNWSLNGKGRRLLSQYARALKECHCMIVGKHWAPAVIEEVLSNGLRTRRKKSRKRKKNAAGV